MNKIAELVLIFLSGLALDTFLIYYCHNLQDKKLNWKNRKIWIIIISMTAFGMIIDRFVVREAKMIISTIFIYIIIYLISEKKAYNAIISFIIIQINLAFSEMIFSGIFNIFYNDDNKFIMTTLSNTIVPLIGLGLMKTKIAKKTYNTMIKVSKYMKYREIAIYSLIIITILAFSSIESYTKLPLPIIIITNTIIAIILIAIIIRFVKTKGNYNSVSNKYQTSVSSLLEYEDMINKYRMNNHENKNELSTIRQMILDNDESVIEYIDKLVEIKNRNNSRINYKSAKIPKGGLRATIYSKLSTMENYKINYKLDISKRIKTVDFIKMDKDIVVNLCSIISIFLDNAIDCVRQAKEKMIIIEMYIVDEIFYIDISNNYNGTLNTEKMDKIKYTTKGKGHGYGLSIVNEKIDESKGIISNERKVHGNIFTQSIGIKMNNKE